MLGTVNEWIWVQETTDAVPAPVPVYTFTGNVQKDFVVFNCVIHKLFDCELI